MSEPTTFWFEPDGLPWSSKEIPRIRFRRLDAALRRAVWRQPTGYFFCVDQAQNARITGYREADASRSPANPEDSIELNRLLIPFMPLALRSAWPIENRPFSPEKSASCGNCRFPGKRRREKLRKGVRHQ